MSEQPAIIDISGLCEGDADALERVARELESACADWGVFHVLGHGIAASQLQRFDAAMRAFFDLPVEAKRAVRRSRDNAWGYYDTELTKNRHDWKEVFDFGAERDPSERSARHSDGVNQWPAAAPPDFREIMLAQRAAQQRVALGLLRAVCLSLGLAPDALDGAFQPGSGFLRLNRYAPCAEPAPPDAPLFPERGHLGVHHHTDAGALTVLYQDEVAGLQAEHREAFVVIEPVAGALTVNLGDMLQVWSNDRYRSPLHRVLASAERTRHSAPYFLNPDYETVCSPLAPLLERGEPARFSAISWAHFRDQRSAGDYADQGREIQIDDFRIA